MRFTKKALFVGIGVTSLMAVSIAWAAWTASGTGSGTAAATTAEELVVTGATATADLYPGGTGDVYISVNNPNLYPVRVTTETITALGDPITSTGGGPGCDSSTGLSIETPVHTNAVNIGAGGNALITLQQALRMSNASHNDCQGATFIIPDTWITVQGASNAS